MRAAAISAGERLGRYEIVRHLATGGMAEIYLARTAGIGAFERYAVVKVIAAERRGNQQFVRMLLDEARLSAALHHANVAQVYEVGEDNGEYFYAMEYVHGDSVRSLLEDSARANTIIPLEVALAIVIAAAAGLHHAHECCGADGQPLGIVHRDVSPSNVMVGYDGLVKVLDFGIARASERATETESGVVKGKYAYMSPEQCRAQPVDRRADGFSLGIILYELVTQSRAFKSDSDFDTMTRIVTGDIVKPRVIRPDLAPALESIILRALAVDPADRYQTVAELGDVLEAFADAQGLSMSQRAVERFLLQVFGHRPEPWRIGATTARIAGGNTPRPTAGSQPMIPRPVTSTSTPLPVRALIVAQPGSGSSLAPMIQIEGAPAPRSLGRPLALGAVLVVVGVVIAIATTRHSPEPSSAASSARGGSARGGSARGGSARVGSARGGSARGGSAESSRAAADPDGLATGSGDVVAPAGSANPGVVAAAIPATAPSPSPVPAHLGLRLGDPTVAPAAATVTIHLTSSPAGATVYLGKLRRGTTPIDLPVPSGPASVTVRLEHAGFRSQTVSVSTARDDSRAVTLMPIARTSHRDDNSFTNPFAK